MINNNVGRDNFGQGSAKIYQFPVGGRAALGDRRTGSANVPAAHTTSPAETICSGSWYHQEAIDEAKPKWDR